jgi:hypothetical protein
VKLIYLGKVRFVLVTYRIHWGGSIVIIQNNGSFQKVVEALILQQLRLTLYLT